jgi:hypothetical protein
MTRTTSEKVGRGACPCCGEPVTYRKSKGGLLTHRCDNCDSTGYAEPGGIAFKARMATVKQDTPPPAASGSPVEPPTKKTIPPTPKPANAGFSLGSL